MKVNQELAGDDRLLQFTKIGGGLAFFLISGFIGVIYSTISTISILLSSGNSYIPAIALFVFLEIALRIASFTMIIRRNKIGRIVYAIMGAYALTYVVYFEGTITSEILGSIIPVILWVIYLFTSNRVKVYLGLVQVNQSGDVDSPYIETQIEFGEDDPNEETRKDILDKLKSQTENRELKK